MVLITTVSIICRFGIICEDPQLNNFLKENTLIFSRWVGSNIYGLTVHFQIHDICLAHPSVLIKRHVLPITAHLKHTTNAYYSTENREKWTLCSRDYSLMYSKDMFAKISERTKFTITRVDWVSVTNLRWYLKLSLLTLIPNNLWLCFICFLVGKLEISELLRSTIRTFWCSFRYRNKKTGRKRLLHLNK